MQEYGVKIFIFSHLFACIHFDMMLSNPNLTKGARTARYGTGIFISIVRVLFFHAQLRDSTFPRYVCVCYFLYHITFNLESY